MLETGVEEKWAALQCSGDKVLKNVFYKVRENLIDLGNGSCQSIVIVTGLPEEEEEENNIASHLLLFLTVLMSAEQEVRRTLISAIKTSS